MPTFPPKLKIALCSWVVLDCLSQFDSHLPSLPWNHVVAVRLIFVFVFLEPLPSLPVSVGYTNLLCWLPDLVLVPTQMLRKSSVQLLSLWTHLPPPGDTATPGNGCSRPASAQAQHLPRTVGNPTPSGFIHQHLHKELKTTSHSQRQR